MSLFAIFSVRNYFQALPYNNNKRETNALAAKDPAMQSFAAGKDVPIEYLSES